ncbi:hypothetical protein SAMN04487820_11068 [Actinopolyspora mzabensis]|uniref:PPE family protein n=1 Tax=Actinopolyspora mzabensis TaxID=995066 RepID=A0A1G9DFZ0_ACTMZ|nr:hypothetical protein [Actinopolyspora mzabensis]SDK62772.1 hypothetical protein SAMN04487820_11068 [Actinopolyspora mzabensis]
MSEGDQGYRSHEYIADREREAYNRARGDFEHQAGGHMPVGNGDMSTQRAKEVAANAAEHYGTQQAKAMSGDQSLRGRPTSLGCTAYESYPHAELEKFVREEFEPTKVHDVGRIYHSHGAKLIEFSDRIKQAAAKTEQNWQGRAGDAMRAQMNTVSAHMGHSGEAAQLAANQIGLQAEAGEQARNSMPEDPQFSLMHELSALASNPNPATIVQRASEIRQRADEAKQAHQEAARVVSTMENDFGGAAENTPRFAPPPQSPDENAGESDTGYNGTGSGGSGFATVGSTTPSSTYAASAPSDTTAPSSGVSNAPGGYYGQPQQPSTTAPAWNSGGNAGNSGLPPGAVRGPDGTNYRQDPRTGQWQRQNSANGRWAPVPPGQQVPGGGRAGGTTGGRGGYSGGRAGGYGAGGYGSGGYGAGGSGSGLGSGGRAGVGGAPTGGPTSGTPANSSGRGGGRMPMGGAGAGAGRGQGEDEEEHERKYVLETDEIGDDLGLPRVAPPVIGATPEEEGGRN